MRRQDKRSTNRQASCAWPLLFALLGGLLSVQSVFASSTFRTERTSIIDVTGDEFSSELMGDPLWIEAEISAADFVRIEYEPVQPGFFDGEYAEIYHLRLQVKRRLFGRDRLPETIDLPEFVTGDPDFFADNFVRPPQPGDQVFANVERNPDGQWTCNYIGIPTKAERRRIDRVKELFELANSWTAAERLLDGCGDDDPDFAVWCMNALSRRGYLGLDPNPAAYGRFREKIDVARYRAKLLQVLDDPSATAEAYVHATYEIQGDDLSAAEAEQFHLAQCGRLQFCLDRPQRLQALEARNLMGTLVEFFYAEQTLERRRDILQILTAYADSQAEDHRAFAFQWACELSQDQHDPLNDEIFLLYRDRPPLRGEIAWLSYHYWSGLARCMELETSRSKQIADAGLDLFEQKLPSADAADLDEMISPLVAYVYVCYECDADRNYLHSRLRTLLALAATAQQRDAITELLRELDIPLPNELQH
ncbi:hypothetical protein C5Y93_03325 [Blastopirellula marina]|uniref:Uncharacterized protein n=2 Tax=Blastopirellula marina TaxID=124 RepID=A0A2S8GTG2_9BACT|nr:hypothetical protein C5Y93_03325 [Blastopirellula marina]